MSAPRITMDSQAGAAYVLLSPERVAGHGDTHELPCGSMVDLDHTGRVSGVELFHPATRVDLAAVMRVATVHPEDAAALRALAPLDWSKPEQYAQPRGRAA